MSSQGALRWALLCLGILFLACGGGDDTDRRAPDPVVRESVLQPGQEGTTFVEVGADCGIDFVNPSDTPTAIEETALSTGFVGGGVCIGDYDGDGLPDVYLTSRRGNRLYRNLGGMRFEDVTAKASVGGHGRWSTGATFVDIDDDGDLDLYVSCLGGPNLCYRNDAGRFVDDASERGLAFEGACVQATFFDADRDGDLDCYLLNNYDLRKSAQRQHALAEAWPRLPHPKYRPRSDGRGYAVHPSVRHLVRVVDVVDGKAMLEMAAESDRFLSNEGGRFVDRGGQAGISDALFGLGVVVLDHNRDGWPDLFVSNDFYGADRLYENNRDGTFTDVIRERASVSSWFSMGVDCADLDGDGLLDLMTSDMAGTTHFSRKLSMGDMSQNAWFLRTSAPQQQMRNMLFLGSPHGRMMEAAFMAGLARTDWTWSVCAGDLDNDGRVDLFFTNGMPRNFFDSDLLAKKAQTVEGLKTASLGLTSQFRNAPVRREHNLAMRNVGPLDFRRRTSWQLEHLGVSHGAALADLDRDGDLDLVVNHFGERCGVYRNDVAQPSGLLVSLRGSASNHFGLDAVVEIETATRRHIRQMTLSRGYCAATEPVLHFGLGSEPIRAITVRWPSGHRQTLGPRSTSRHIVVHEPAGKAPQPDVTPAAGDPLFEESLVLRGYNHYEQDFDDFEAQPLLPRRQSRWGPGLALGDLDGDGREDLWVGAGASGIATLLKTHPGVGTLAAPALSRAAKREDMAGLWLDADSDGDLDLLICGGGNESALGSAPMADVLYINEGGKLVRGSPIDAARDSSGCVAAADIDGDGDLDVFVGCRQVPGKYPLSGPSRLLLNEGGRFRNVTERMAPGLARAGMVTGALWSDVDDDGRLDLLLTTEWGPIRLFMNRGARLVEQTKKAGLDLHGWWNGIAGADIDGDGDIDYVVSNYGLNTKYKASRKAPLWLYYGDMDGSGSARIVEAYGPLEKQLPVRGFSCSSAAMPTLRKKVGTFRNFAQSTLDQIYGQRMHAVRKLEVHELASCALLNDGQGRFTIERLPRYAQLSPSFGVALGDLNGDGLVDCVLAQNFSHSEPETGRMDGGLGVVLLGRPGGKWVALRPHESGVIMPQDARAIAIHDVDGDGRPDLVAGTNQNAILCWRNRRTTTWSTVRFQGRPGNTCASGTRVLLRWGDGRKRALELYAGQGYLTQAAPVLYLPPGVRSLEIRWPGGERQTISTLAPGQNLLTQPPRK